MIACHLSAAARYTVLHPLFARAFALAGDPELRVRAAGSYDLGDGLRVNLDVGATEAATARRFESHRQHIDIQVVLAGPERMQWARLDELQLDQDFQPGADIAFYHPPARIPVELVLGPDELTIFWPEDAHRPCCHPADHAVAFRKLVFKVPVLAQA
jgi:biofilm protein TabA